MRMARKETAVHAQFESKIHDNIGLLGLPLDNTSTHARKLIRENKDKEQGGSYPLS
jgi:hypothetical protein